MSKVTVTLATRYSYLYYIAVLIRFSVHCYLPIIFSVCCWANFLMFTLSGENTVKCLESFREKIVSVHRKNIFFIHEYNDKN